MPQTFDVLPELGLYVPGGEATTKQRWRHQLISREPRTSEARLQLRQTQRDTDLPDSTSVQSSRRGSTRLKVTATQNDENI